MIIDLLFLPCMACLQAIFAVLLTAKTWQIRRLQSYVILAAGGGLLFMTLATVFFWLAAPKLVIAVSALLGYLLLLLGGWMGKLVEEEDKSAFQSHDTSSQPKPL